MLPKMETWDVKLSACFLVLVGLTTSRQTDANCMIRFYAVKHNQCPCWTYDGMKWMYQPDVHIHSDEIITPSRSFFVVKSIRTLTDNFEQCDIKWKICLKKGRFCSKTLRILPSTPKTYHDVTKWEVGRYRMRALGVHMLKKRIKSSQNDVLGCIGKECEETLTGKKLLKL